MDNATNCINIQSNAKLNMSPEGDFFRVWVDFLKPVHNLTKREMDVLALYLKERHELLKKINDQETVDNVLMSDNTRRKIKDACGIKSRHLNVILSAFRKKGVIKDNKFYLNLIPVFNKDGAALVVVFNFKNDKKFIKLGNRANQ